MRLFLLLILVASFSIARAQTTTNSAPSAPSTTPDPVQQAKTAAAIAQLRDANKMLAAGNTDAALAKANAVIQANPQNVAAYALRGAIYSQKKMWPQAGNDFEAAHLLMPNNQLIKFNLAETKFVQKQYDAARPGFLELSGDRDTDIGDLSAYKVFLCDLFAGHMDMAQKELDAFNQIGSHASYYYSNAAWDLAHHQTEDGRGWLASASTIYSPQKNGFYQRSLLDQGYLPLPPPPSR